jgi:dTDP-4-dehydrorhamnose 3,5-epimerase
LYYPEYEGGIAWDDPEVGVEWPYRDPVLSRRDQNQSTLKQYRQNPAFK